MNGPEHYKEAERILGKVAKDRDEAAGLMIEPAHAIQIQLAYQASMAAAQTHATLALTAATAFAAASRYDGDEDGSRTRGWANIV